MKITQGLLYQVRIKVSEETAEAIRAKELTIVTKSLLNICDQFGTSLVCTFDAFCGYCEEAEKNGIEKYSLYYWTKSVINDPVKKSKHLKSFAFYRGRDQTYDRELALNLHFELKRLLEQEWIEDLNLIDNDPKNNPQPPRDDKI